MSYLELPNHLLVMVGCAWNMKSMFRSVGNVIIPSDELIYFSEKSVQTTNQTFKKDGVQISSDPAIGLGLSPHRRIWSPESMNRKSEASKIKDGVLENPPSSFSIHHQNDSKNHIYIYKS